MDKSVAVTKEANQQAAWFRLRKGITINSGAVINVMPRRMVRQKNIQERIAKILTTPAKILIKY